jgi:hypothetical protein
MARKKAPELSPEAVAANKAGEADRRKEKQARRKNAEKQKRFRESMKAEGYKRLTLWEPPAPEGTHKRLAGMGFRQIPAWEIPQENAETARKKQPVKVRLAVRIRETSLNAGARLPTVQKALASSAAEFLKALGDTPGTNALYNDFLELIKTMGDPWGEE